MDRREFLLGAVASAAAVQAPGNAAAQGHRPPPAPSGSKPRSSEIRELRTFAEQTHPRGREAAADPAWRDSWDRLEHTASQLADGPYLVRARRALAWLEDGHTTVLPFEFIGQVPAALAHGAFGLSLPWKVKLFDDGAYVVAASDELKGALGARVNQLGKLSAAELMKAFDSTWPGNRAWAQNWGALAFVSPAQFHGLGAVTDPAAPVTARLSGGSAPITLKPLRDAATPAHQLARKKAERELWAEAAGRGNYVKALPERNAIFASIDEMADGDGFTFRQLSEQLFALMQAAPSARLIIDLRRNGGGDNFLGEPLRKHIEQSSFNQRERLFVLIGPATFSAAQNLANRIERETAAIFVGTPTGLSPNHYGDAKIFNGPASGMLATVSTLAWFDSYPQDRRNWIVPDFIVPATFDDWRSGRDPALEAALTQTLVSSVDEFAGERVFYYSRGSQKQQWKSFWT